MKWKGLKTFTSVAESWWDSIYCRIILLLVCTSCPSGSTPSSSRNDLSDCPDLGALRTSSCKSILFDSYLLAFEPRPPSALKHMIKVRKIHSANEIDKTIANIALISDITRKVEKVVSIGKKGVNFFRKLLDSVLVRNISDHNCCSTVVHDLVFS